MRLYILTNMITMSLGAAECVQGNASKPIKNTLDIYGKRISFEIDPGADMTQIPSSVYYSFDKRPTLETPTM